MSTEGAIAVGKLIADLGKVVGRKRLQKIVHLLGAGGAREFRQRFALHYFGPFSRELASELDFLVATNLVMEDPPKFDGDSYAYLVADSESINRLYSEEFGAPSWGALAKVLNDEETPELEAMSTLIFLANHRTPAERIESEFQRLKPHLKDVFHKARLRAVELRLLSEKQ